MRVLIQSFSFQNGYPGDKTGKGGGFVFDCRAIDAFDYSLDKPACTPFPHMHLTGLDPEVVGVLDRDLDTQVFFLNACTMVKMDIRKCLRRGFNIMTVNFGCTAGQHRSVYMAECLAKLIRQNYPEVEVELVHLERSHWPKGA